MKKTICLILAALALTVSSCEPPTYSNECDANEDELTLVFHGHNGTAYHRTISTIRFEYEGHRYIYMDIYGADGQGTFIHDPNCPCRNQEKITPAEEKPLTTKFSWEE